VTNPVNSAGQGPGKAYLEILVPEGIADPVIPVQFNPTEYQLQKSNNFAEIAIPGLETPPVQYVRGNAHKLTAELLVDTSDTLEDVRKRHVTKLRDLLNINSDLHAPPIVRLVWDGEVFKGVVESLNITYTLFTPEGTPIRAKLNLTLMEYRSVEEQKKATPKFSPDVEKVYIVKRGDTLASVAASVYSDPTLWREIARNNEIMDPRRLPPGLILNLPRLRQIR